jgi:hypothetical protein
MTLRRLAPVACALALGLPASAHALDPVTDWSSLLPGLTATYDPNSANDCVAGRIQCVDAVIREMNRRFAPLAQSCDHRALFALLYLVVTQHYHDTVVDDPGFFSDTPFVNHEDAVFAGYYFDAFDNYAKGNRAAVPRAWQIAFDSMTGKQTTGSGDIILGVNAHIQRDLPFVLYRIGLVKPDGTSRKPDHDKVNDILYGAYGDAIAQAAARFDPSVDTHFHPYDEMTLFQLVEGWRETAWRNAERLASAPDDAARAVVAQSIEDNATSQAQLLKASSLYAPLQDSSSRDAYCAAHNGA